MSAVKKTLGIVGAVALCASLAACDGFAGNTQQNTTSVVETQVPEPTPAPTDPKLGWVYVGNISEDQNWDFIYKKCDGTTLLYAAPGFDVTSITLVPNDPACAPA